MTNIRCFYLVLFLIGETAVSCGAVADTVINTPVYGDYNLTSTTTITESGSFSGGVINVGNSLTIHNGGTIHSSLHICSGCEVRIQNYGTYDAPVTVDAGASFTQVITNQSDIRALSNVGLGYNVLVQDTPEALDWQDIVDNTTGATGYTLSTAKIRVDNISTIDGVKLENLVLVYTDTMPDSDVVVFSNVTGDGVVRVVYNENDSLYSVNTRRVGGDIVARIVRASDYAQVTGGKDGDFLNLLRQKSPNDKLLKRLDSANTINGFQHVMSKSVKLHPIKLMQSIETMYSHKSLEIMHIEQNDSLSIMPISIFSENLFVFGIVPSVSLNIDDDLRIKLSANVSSLKYFDDINNYSGTSYGIDVDSVYDLSDNVFVRAYGGFNFSMFDTGFVFNGSGATKNPNGISVFGAGEAGRRFSVDETTYLSPFVTLGGDYENVMRFNRYNFYAGTGVDAETCFVVDGMRYAYALRGLVRTDSIVGGDLKVSVWSTIDSAGVDFTFGALYDNDIGTSYHMSLNAKFNF